MAGIEDHRQAEAAPAFELAAFALDGVACRTPGGDVSREDFLAHVEGVAAALPAMNNVGLLACENTLHFAIGLCALLRAGRDIVMPPNLQAETLTDRAFSHCARVDDAFVSAQLPRTPRPVPFNPDGRITLFTSGSTGEPKRVEKRLRQLSAEAEVLETTFGDWLGNAAIGATVPHIHIYGMLFRVIWPLAAGRPFVTETPLGGNLPPGHDLGVVSSPAFLGRIQPDRLAAARPRVVFSSGGRLPEDRARELAAACGAPLVEVYGSTETGGIAWRAWRPDCDRSWAPFPGTRLEINDQHILAVSSAATDGIPIETGDRVSLEDDDRFRLEGRADGVLKIEDKRISPAALVEHLERLEWVAEARVLEVAGRRRQLGAVLRLEESGAGRLETLGRNECIRELREHMLNRFEAVVVPRRWRFVDAFPLNAMGKTTLADLAALFDAREDA